MRNLCSFLPMNVGNAHSLLTFSIYSVTKLEIAHGNYSVFSIRTYSGALRENYGALLIVLENELKRDPVVFCTVLRLRGEKEPACCCTYATKTRAEL